MSQEYIEIHGARENNLRDVSLRIPKRKITIFTGVSGSGKSSIVFDTIATEAQRLLNENFSMFVRNLLPRFAQPDADAIEQLSMAIVVDQKRRWRIALDYGHYYRYFACIAFTLFTAGSAICGLFQRIFI